MSTAILQDLTLFSSQSVELLELLHFREDTANSPDLTPPEIAQGVAACDKAIAEYIQAQVTQIDKVAAVWRECGARIDAIKAERQRLAYAIAQWEGRRDRIEQITEMVMGALKTKRLDGTSSSFAIKANPPSVEVSQPELVPGEYKRLTITLTEAAFTALCGYLARPDRIGTPESRDLARASLLAELMGAKRTEPEVSKSAVAAELKQRCPACQATWGLTNNGEPKCSACGGTGKRTLPGAHLVTDKTRLEVK